VTDRRFIGEKLHPVAGSCETERMALGEPGLPQSFRWRGETVEVISVTRRWRSTGRCRHGSPEQYVRRHWFEVQTRRHGTLTVYFERQARRGGDPHRWWVFSLQGRSDTRVSPG